MIEGRTASRAPRRTRSGRQKKPLVNVFPLGIVPAEWNKLERGKAGHRSKRSAGGGMTQLPENQALGYAINAINAERVSSAGPPTAATWPATAQWWPILWRCGCAGVGAGFHSLPVQTVIFFQECVVEAPVDTLDLLATIGPRWPSLVGLSRENCDSWSIP